MFWHPCFYQVVVGQKCGRRDQTRTCVGSYIAHAWGRIWTLDFHLSGTLSDADFTQASISFIVF